MKRTIMMTAIALMTGVLAGYWFCHARWEADTERMNASRAREESERLKKVLEDNRNLQEIVRGLQARMKKENDHAKREYDALLARLHRGTARMSVPVRKDGGLSCTGRAADDAGQTRAELDPETAERILSVGRDGDEAIRELNQCIDQYRAVEKACKQTS